MNILLIDDHVLFAESLKLLLEDYEGIKTFYILDKKQDPLDIISKNIIDILLIDINLKNLMKDDGISLCKRILEVYPRMKCIMLTGYNKPIYVEECKKIGAKGFISKDVRPEELWRIIQAVNQGYTYFPEMNHLMDLLTNKEIEVLKELYKGLKRSEISKKLYISERTVSNHINSIFSKFQVDSSTKAITKGIQLGYIKPF